MGYLLVQDGIPIEYRAAAPDDPEEWEEVEESDPRIAEIGSKSAQWGAFRLSVLDKEQLHGQQFHAALTLFMAHDPILTGALMSEASKDAPWAAYLRGTWNALAAAVEYLPPEGAVTAWNTIALQTNVPLEWLPNGRLATPDP